MIHLLVFLSFDGLFSETAPCQDGDLRLVGSFILEGRLEICFEEKWGTVCDDRWDDKDATEACRQLGFSDAGSEALPGSYVDQLIGSGEGPIWLDEVNCSGKEMGLNMCGNATHDCTHAEDAGIRCRHQGKPILVFNKIIYTNNSLIKMEDITDTITASSFANTLQCITDRYPCCNSADEATWVEPNNVDVPNQSNFLQMQTSQQTVLLARNVGMFVPNGVFHCRIKNSLNVTHQIYIGLYLDGLGTPTITSFSYDRASQTLTCLSIGGPTTTTTWRKDGSILTGTKYHMSQFILNTSSALYENNLTLSSEEYGTYSCTVENSAGLSYAEFVVKTCTDGEAVLERNGRQVKRICYNGSFHMVESSTNGSTVFILGALTGILVISLLTVIVISIVTHWNAGRLRKDKITVHDQGTSADKNSTIQLSCTDDPSTVVVAAGRKFDQPQSSTNSMVSNAGYGVVSDTTLACNDDSNEGISFESEDNYDVIKEVNIKQPQIRNLSHRMESAEEVVNNGSSGNDEYDNNVYEHYDFPLSNY